MYLYCITHISITPSVVDVAHIAKWYFTVEHRIEARWHSNSIFFFLEVTKQSFQNQAGNTEWSIIFLSVLIVINLMIA